MTVMLRGYQDALDPAVSALDRGELVAFPTETVYGLGADGLNPDAVHRIFLVKGRPQDNPLILHVASLEEAWKLCREVPEAARVLAERFWPGPLTMVLPAAHHIPSVVTAGLDTVGIRVPSHPIALKLLRSFAGPIAAPSANRSGRPSPTTALDVLEDLEGQIPYIIDGGSCDVGVESTILSIPDQGSLQLLRPGRIAVQEMEDALQAAGLPATIQRPRSKYDLPELDADEAPQAPGMKYRHYAPRAQVLLLPEAPSEQIEAILDVLSHLKAHRRLGVYVSDRVASRLPKNPALEILTFTCENAGEAAAHGLFHSFRTFDRLNCDQILVAPIAGDGIATAYMNRLLKASSQPRSSGNDAKV